MGAGKGNGGGMESGKGGLGGKITMGGTQINSNDYEDIYQMILKDSNLKSNNAKKNEYQGGKSKPITSKPTTSYKGTVGKNNKFQSSFGGQPDYGDDYDEPAGPMVPCSKCGRTFAEDRLAKHQKVCKVNSKPKKVKYFYKPVAPEKPAHKGILKPEPKWKREHEDFMQAMKYNRMMKRAEDKGIPLKNLPPPPPSKSDPSLIPCPHCGRKFGQVQAERHIPKCQNTISKAAPPPMRGPRVPDSKKNIYSNLAGNNISHNSYGGGMGTGYKPAGGGRGTSYDRHGPSKGSNYGRRF